MVRLLVAVGVFVVSVGSARAQIEQDLDKRNRFYIGPTLHFNISATMRNLPVPPNTGPMPPGAGLQYDDGFIGVDISGNFGGQTWFWGYSTNNQQIPGTTLLEMHGVASPRDNVIDKLTGDPEFGLEAGYGREFWRFGDPKKPKRVGFELSFTANSLGLEMFNAVVGDRMRSADRFDYGGILLPDGPYSGTFQGPIPPSGPMPIITTNYVSQLAELETVEAKQRAQIEGTYWAFRIGPFAEIPITGRFQASIGVGLQGAHVDATLSYFEKFRILTPHIGAPPPDRVSSATTDTWLFGGYLDAKLQYWINPVVAVYVGGQFQTMQDFNLGALDKRATVDFGQTFGINLGMIYSF